MEAKLEVKQLKPYLYLMDEGHQSTGYILIGDEKVCVIDTMIGLNNLYDVVRSYTDKPIMVINTHGHPDHIYGNIYFDEAYINPIDIPLAESFYKEPAFLEEFNKRGGVKIPPFKEIKGGDVIDLGGKTLEVYDLPGHTRGSIMLLLKEDRILFTGDAINHHLWMQFEDCVPLKEFADNIDRLLFLEDRADVILHGHAHDYDDISLMRSVRDGVLEIVNGQTENDKPYEWFGGIGKQHPYKVDPNGHFQQDDHVICYSD
ncbi:MAG: MBL fold metallo-hydrolase [Lachnospiraceae bacterium]|nr:MBL fold metallo-hydrolase [Lachnospiraceae bacterium]